MTKELHQNDSYFRNYWFIFFYRKSENNLQCIVNSFQLSFSSASHKLERRNLWC